MVRHTFFYWIDHYYQALEATIIERQRIDPLVWIDLSAMERELLKNKARSLKLPALAKLTPEQIAAFLAEEQTEAEL